MDVADQQLQALIQQVAAVGLELWLKSLGLLQRTREITLAIGPLHGAVGLLLRAGHGHWGHAGAACSLV
jgi:hypothetical protein